MENRIKGISKEEFSTRIMAEIEKRKSEKKRILENEMRQKERAWNDYHFKAVSRTRRK